MFSAVHPAKGESDSMDYWRRHWASIDESTRPSSTWRSSHITRLGGGTYHYDRDLQYRNSTPLGGGSFHYDGDLDSAYMTPLGGGSYHAQRSFYRGSPRPGWNTRRTTPWLPLGIR
jgi:hypothetical protein